MEGLLGRMRLVTTVTAGEVENSEDAEFRAGAEAAITRLKLGAHLLLLSNSRGVLALPLHDTNNCILCAAEVPLVDAAAQFQADPNNAVLAGRVASAALGASPLVFIFRCFM